MMPVEMQVAAAKVAEDYNGKRWRLGRADCATLCRDYWALLTGVEHKWDLGARLSVKAVTGLLGRPERHIRPGDVVLTRDHLAVNLGYCLLTMIEGEGVARVPVADCIGWRPRWARAS